MVQLRKYLSNESVVFSMIIILIFILAFLACYHTYLGPREEVERYGVSIYNPTNKDIRFSLSFDKKTWSTYALMAGDGDLFKANYNGVIYIKILSKSNNIRTIRNYKLSRGEKYEIFWNSKEQVWDIQLYSPD